MRDLLDRLRFAAWLVGMWLVLAIVVTVLLVLVRSGNTTERPDEACTASDYSDPYLCNEEGGDPDLGS